MHTRKNVLLVFGLFAVGLIAGCGGGSSDDHTSRYIGGYDGAFTTGSSQQGTVTITVDKDGDVSGLVSNTTIDAQGPITGRINDSGKADLTFTYTGLGSADLTGQVNYSAADNKLSGTLTQSVNGTTVDTVQFSLEKRPQGGHG